MMHTRLESISLVLENRLGSFVQEWRVFVPVPDSLWTSQLFLPRNNWLSCSLRLRLFKFLKGKDNERGCCYYCCCCYCCCLLLLLLLLQLSLMHTFLSVYMVSCSWDYQLSKRKVHKSPTKTPRKSQQKYNTITIFFRPKALPPRIRGVWGEGQPTRANI